MAASMIGGFCRSSRMAYDFTRGSSSGASNGRLAAAVTRPVRSVTTNGRPRARTCSPRRSNASASAPARGSFNPPNTPEYSRLVAVASAWKWRKIRIPVPRLRAASRATSAATMVGASRCSRSLRTEGQAIDAQVGHQRLRYPYRSVGRLVVLQKRDNGAWKGDAGGVERVHELRLGFGSRAVANVRPPSLKVGEGAGAGHLEPGPHPGCPHLEVISAGAGEAGIARGELDDPIRQPQALKNSLSMPGDALVLRR